MTVARLTDVPYSETLSGETTFANFKVLWLFAKVFSTKFGHLHRIFWWHQWAIHESFPQKSTNLQKFSAIRHAGHSRPVLFIRSERIHGIAWGERTEGEQGPEGSCRRREGAERGERGNGWGADVWLIARQTDYTALGFCVQVTLVWTVLLEWKGRRESKDQREIWVFEGHKGERETWEMRV